MRGLRFRPFSTNVEYSLKRRDKAVGVRRVTQHIVQPDEQIEVREKRFHCRSEIGNGVRCTMQDSIQRKDTERRVERLAFLRVLGERELPIPMYEVELEEDGCTSQRGKHGIRMRHRPHMLLSLSVDRMEVDGETKSFRAIVWNNE